MDFYIRLTKRQNEVMKLLSQGYKIKAIANKLSVKTTTIKTHIMQIYNRFGISNTNELDVRILAINKYRQYKQAKEFMEA